MMGMLWAVWWLPFANGGLLAWGALAAAPLVIHLLSKRKYKETQWAAMRFLLAAVKKSSRKIRLEQWLLLAVRTLVVLLLVLALAQPYWESAVGGGMMQGERTHKVIVLDGSFSMAYKPGDKTLFDRAKTLALEIVNSSAQGDGFTLLLMADPPQVVVGTPAYEPEDFGNEITNLRLPHGGADLSATVSKIHEVLNTARRDSPKLVREEVYLLTDLGRSSWTPEFSGQQAVAEFRRRSKQLADEASLVVIDLGQAGAENVAVTDVRSRQAFATVGQQVQVEAQLRNFSRNAKGKQRVELYVDGRAAAEQTVEIAPGAARTVLFSHQFGQGGDHALEVRLAADLLEVDDHRWLALPVKEYLRVLCVNGKPTGDPFTGATGYLEAALTPSEVARGRALVRTEVVHEGALQEISSLRVYDCIFLCNVRQFIGAEAKRLDDYLQGGGGLVFFLGDQVQPESYNRFLGGADDQGLRLLPAQLGRLHEGTDPAEKFFLDPQGYKHPILAPFEGNPAAGLVEATVEKFYELKLPPDTKARTVLGVKGQGPLIVEESIHRGRCVLVATSADRSWTPLPFLPSYVPIVHEVLTFAVSGRTADQNTTVGQSIGGSVSAAASAASLKLQLPVDESGQARTESVSLISAGDLRNYSYGDTYTSGVYLFQFGPPVSRDEVFAVNVNPCESDLTKFEVEELRSEVWPDVQFSYETGWQGAVEQPVNVGQHRSELHTWLLYAALLLLFVETWMAWAFDPQPVAA